jgi:DNA adenine methylase
MKYMGIKRIIAKYILPIMLEGRKPNQWWVEPFVGGGNVIDKVDGNRMGSDANHFVIEALISIRDCVSELPRNNKEFTEDDYYVLKQGGNYKHKGYAGFVFSYGAKWLNSYSRDKTNRDYVKEAYNSAVKQSPNLFGVKLQCCNYDDLLIPEKSIIYCDPPYENTTKYKLENNVFDHKAFWQWCRDKSKEGHNVFVSEYNAPYDFECIWQNEITSGFRRNNKI